MVFKRSNPSTACPPHILPPEKRAPWAPGPPPPAATSTPSGWRRSFQRPRSWTQPWQPPCCNFYPSLKQSLLATCHMSTRPWDQWITPPDPILTGLTETLTGLKQGSVPLTLMNVNSLVQPWQNSWPRPWWRTGPFSGSVSHLGESSSYQGTGSVQFPGDQDLRFCQGTLSITLSGRATIPEGWGSNSVVHAETKLQTMGAGARNHWDQQLRSKPLTGGPQLSLLLMAKCIGAYKSPSKRGKRERSSLLT